MKILWTHNFNPDVKGSGNFMHQFANAMNKKGVNIELYYLGNLSNPLQIIKAILYVRKESNKYDIVHAQYGSACALITAFCKAPKILTLRGSDWYLYPRLLSLPGIRSLIGIIFTRISINYFNQIIVMSNRMRKDISKKISIIPEVNVLTDPVDLNLFKPMSRYDARAKLGYKDDFTIWIIFVSHNTKNPIKRFSLAQTAVSLTQNGDSKINIKFLNEKAYSEMPYWIAGANLILSTSIYEGWPNCIKEALACNIPFVSTDVSDLQLIAEQEESCFVCDPSPAHISKSINRALNQNPKDLRRYVEHMNLDDSTSMLLDFYKKTYLT
jgi:teichuronic acid biosynthesis glycosyltransferase TuaC